MSPFRVQERMSDSVLVVRVDVPSVTYDADDPDGKA